MYPNGQIRAHFLMPSAKSRVRLVMVDGQTTLSLFEPTGQFAGVGVRVGMWFCLKYGKLELILRCSLQFSSNINFLTCFTDEMKSFINKVSNNFHTLISVKKQFLMLNPIKVN